jgi:hypothetical protein
MPHSLVMSVRFECGTQEGGGWYGGRAVLITGDSFLEGRPGPVNPACTSRVPLVYPELCS